MLHLPVPEPAMEISQKIAIVTGAASGIGEAVGQELCNRGVRGLALVDMSEGIHDVAARMETICPKTQVTPFVGDTTDPAFRARVYDQVCLEMGIPSICVPAAGITRDSLAVKIDKETGRPEIYPLDHFRLVIEVNLLAPIYWALEMVARIATDRHKRGLRRWDPDEHVQGTIIFIGSISSQGNKGQISYASTKAGLEGAAATLMKEAMFHGVRCGVIHPGFTDTPMVRALGEDFIKEHILPQTQLRRLIRPEEIAHAICFMIANSAVSGQLWADAGWHPIA
jgi:NAD(P)-dependent dehydrogenase (short-subunit alcohol dehydrogenase family)